MTPLALVAALLLAPSAQEGTIVDASGASVNVRDVTLSLQGADLTASFAPAGGERRTMKAAEIVELVFRNPPAPPAGGAPLEVTLTTGDVLMGAAGEKSDEGVQLVSKIFSNPLLKFERIRSIIFTANSRDLPKRLPEKGDVNDTIFTTTGDRASGTVLSLSSAGLVYHSVIFDKELTLPLAKVTGIWFSKSEPPKEPSTLYSTVLTTDGSSVRGEIQSLDKGTLTLKDLYGTTHAVAAGALSGIYMKNGRVVYLSDLQPRAVEENANYISSVQKSPGDLEFPWRRDRSAREGKLVLGNVEHRKGIGVHAHSALTFDLGGGFKRFQTAFGVDRGALESAAVTGEVWVDGKQVKTLTLSRADAPQNLDLDVAGAKELKIVVTWAGTNQSCWAGWGSARLIR